LRCVALRFFCAVYIDVRTESSLLQSVIVAIDGVLFVCSILMGVGVVLVGVIAVVAQQFLLTN
jgi:hypothetical protein